MLGLSIFACSNDNEGSSNTTETSDFTNALPLNNGNYWTYDVVGNTTTRDSLYISGDTLIPPHTYKNLKQK